MVVYLWYARGGLDPLPCGKKSHVKKQLESMYRCYNAISHLQVFTIVWQIMLVYCGVRHAEETNVYMDRYEVVMIDAQLGGETQPPARC